jgi:hypothetical protein
MDGMEFKTIVLPGQIYNYRAVYPFPLFDFCKRILKIPKGQSESAYRRRTDNTMAKEKDKRTNNNLQNIHEKQKIE